MKGLARDSQSSDTTIDRNHRACGGARPGIGQMDNRVSDFVRTNEPADRLACFQISTPMTMQLDDGMREELGAQVPLGSFGTPEDVAWIISALVSPNAKFVTGATYDINGGVRME